jgi:hypothetical protein
MKKIIGFVFFLLFELTASAQYTSKNGNLEFAFGASVPVSKFASGEAGNHIQGFAKTGQSLEVSYYHPTKTKIGWMLMLSGQRNPLNTSALENEYSNTPFYSLGFSTFPNPPPSAPTYYDNWEFDKEAWYTVSLMTGVYTNLPINQKQNLFFTVRGAIGASYVSSPRFNGKASTDTTLIQIWQNKNDAFGFSYSISPGLMHVIKQGSNLCFNINYLGTLGMNFDKMKTGSSAQKFPVGNPGLVSSVYTWMRTSDLTQSVQKINFSLGIQFKL